MVIGHWSLEMVMPCLFEGKSAWQWLGPLVDPYRLRAAH